jgi:hypothetical protein
MSQFQLCVANYNLSSQQSELTALFQEDMMAFVFITFDSLWLPLNSFHSRPSSLSPIRSLWASSLSMTRLQSSLSRSLHLFIPTPSTGSSLCRLFGVFAAGGSPALTEVRNQLHCLNSVQVRFIFWLLPFNTIICLSFFYANDHLLIPSYFTFHLISVWHPVVFEFAFRATDVWSQLLGFTCSGRFCSLRNSVIIRNSHQCIASHSYLKVMGLVMFIFVLCSKRPLKCEWYVQQSGDSKLCKDFSVSQNAIALYQSIIGISNYLSRMKRLS